MIEADGRTWVTAAEAHEHLGPDVTPGLVRNWARHNKISGHRIGRETYYDLNHLTETEHATRTSKRGNQRGSAYTSKRALQS